MDKRARSEIFRARVLEAMARAEMSRSALARAVDADRSTIGQLLQEGETRLPNGQLLADIAGALRVSSDWLLGLSERPEQSGDILARALEVTGASRSAGLTPADDQILAWHREARGYKIRHVPTTLPEMLKINALLRWEYGPFLGKTPDEAILSNAELVAWIDSGQSDFEIALPRHHLTEFAAGTGYYAGLDAGIRRAQLDYLAERCDALYPRLRLFVFDARAVFSVPITIFGPLLASIYVGKFFLTFRDPERLRTLTDHFDWLVREASVDARDAAATIADLAGAVDSR